MLAAEPATDEWRNEMAKGALADVIAREGPRIGACQLQRPGRERPSSTPTPRPALISARAPPPC